MQRNSIQKGKRTGFDSLLTDQESLLCKLCNQLLISGFVYEDYDMDATIYINGLVVMSEQSGDKGYFEDKLQKGQNIVSIIGKPLGRYNSVLNLFVLDQKMGQLDLEIVDQNNISEC